MQDKHELQEEHLAELKSHKEKPVVSSPTAAAPTQEDGANTVNQEGVEEEEASQEEREELLLKLTELKSRKFRIEQLLSLLTSFQSRQNESVTTGYA